MSKMNSNTSNNIYWKKSTLLLFYILSLIVFVSCVGEENVDIALAANPPSLILGTSTKSTITAKSDFFEKSIDTPLVSDRGLTISSFKRKDSRHARLVFDCDDETIPGLHHFELRGKGGTARLDMSVIMSDPGPGEVTVEGAEASSGIDFGVFSIHGEGTNFDDSCALEAEGADGFEVLMISVKGPTRIDVVYSVALDQDETVADMTLIDGEQTYSFPFEIVRHKEYENARNDQSVRRGRTGRIVIEHEDAALGTGAIAFSEDGRIEFGSITEGDSSDYFIPVRVPFDFEDDSFDFQLRTFTDGGSKLEIVKSQVNVLPQRFLVASPAVLPMDEGVVTINIDAQGIDLTEIEEIAFRDSEHLRILEFTAESPSLGRAIVEIDVDAHPGKVELVASDSLGGVDGFVVLSSVGGMRSYYQQLDIPVGDSAFLPIAVQSGDLRKSSSSLTEREGIEIVDLLFIDDYSVVAQVKAEPDAVLGPRNLVLSGDSYDYVVSLNIVEAEL